MKIKKIFFAVISIFVLFAFVVIFNARAVYDGGGGLAVGTKVTVSKDGTNFYNYTADENPGGQTLYVSPGDTLTFRGTVWNAGTIDSVPSFQGIITNAQYFDSFDAFEGGNDDIDGSGSYYVLNDSNIVNGSMVMDIGIWSHLDNTKDEENPEIGQITARLKSDIPDQTVIQGTFSLVGAAPYLTFNPFPIAHAQGVLDESVVRIVVQNPSGATAPTITTLPQTGPDYSFLYYFLGGIIFVSAFTFFIVLKSTNKKEKA